jgi:uracil-DNA glycosylase family 4
MTLITKNQNDNLNEEFNDVYEIKYVFSNTPLNRFQTKPGVEEKTDRLNALKVRIQGIKDCELRKNAENFVFNDGDINSSVMIVGEGPGQKEDEEGKPFVGDAGLLLNKMLNAIKIDRSKIYITNVVNFRPPNNRKPQPGEILRYSNFLREHIEIINPKILILMGSTAMEALYGSNIKISKERGKWKDLIINQKTYLTILTFHPAYLLRKPDQKKFSWADLKIIKKKIDELKINI